MSAVCLPSFSFTVFFLIFIMTNKKVKNPVLPEFNLLGSPYFYLVKFTTETLGKERAHFLVDMVVGSFMESEVFEELDTYPAFKDIDFYNKGVYVQQLGALLRKIVDYSLEVKLAEDAYLFADRGGAGEGDAPNWVSPYKDIPPRKFL